MINAKNVNNYDTETLKKSAHIIDTMYYSLLKTISNIERDRAKIFDIYNIYHRTDDVKLKVDISQKVITIQNNLFDALWNISCKKDERCIKKAKTDKEHDRHLNELNEITTDNDISLSNAVSEMKALLLYIKDMFKPVYDNLRNAKKIGIKGIGLLEKPFMNNANEIRNRIKEVADNFQ